MSSRPKKVKRIYFIYWILLAYIIAALVWWFIALLRQNESMADFKRKELRSHPGYQSLIINVEEERKRKIAQYVGEGSIFFLLIIAGAVFVFRAVRRQFKQSQHQQHFMMAITHELKTPIAVSKLNLETMQKHRLDEARQQRLIQNTLQEANRLNDLCNNLLLSSQIEAGGTVSTPEEIDMASLLQKTVYDYTVRYPERKIEGSFEENVPVNGDPVLLQMAVSNLIENALKYSPKEKPVKLLLSKTGKLAIVQVIDEGPGIADTEKKKIFDKFYRLGNEATKKAKGTGLGLYLVKKIIFTHKGQINLADNPGGGSIFALSLPLSEV
ncbi:MAG: ATP-binding protein [Ferruginibacter sp.]